jgi:hypothetical protein
MDLKAINRNAKKLQSAFTKTAIKQKKRYFAEWFGLNVRDIEEKERFFSEFDWRDKEQTAIHFRVKEKSLDKYSWMKNWDECYVLNELELEVEFRLHALLFFSIHEAESDDAILRATAKLFALAPADKMFEIIREIPEINGFWTDERIQKLKTYYGETKSDHTSISATGVAIRGESYTIVAW